MAGIPVLDIDELLNNVNARVNIVFPEIATENFDVEQVVGFVQDNFDIGGGNTFTNPLESQAVISLNEILNTLKFGAETVGAGAYAKKIPWTILTVQGSIDVWSGSERPTFQVPMTFVATRPEDDVTEMVSKLYSTVYPTFRRSSAAATLTNFKKQIKKLVPGVPVDSVLPNTISLDKVAVLVPPLDYFPNVDGRTANGTVMVQIGSWFRASGQVMKRVQFTFSKEVTSSGNPLYATGVIQFHPFRIISVDELVDYFIG